MNLLFVAKKPAGISSNGFLEKLKKKYGSKKAGFSGTLDPFASGNLIIAFGQYTKLFPFLNTNPKIYKATIWLGAKSPSLDNQNIEKIDLLNEFDPKILEKTRQNLLGKILYTPPKFSAKRVAGKRAYELARKGEDFSLKECEMEIFSSKILSYSHPFLNLEISVSKGAYIRSYAQIFCQNLGVFGTLCQLERVSEGKFYYENEKKIDPLWAVDLEENFYFGDENDIKFGKKLEISDLKIQKDGNFILKFKDFFSIIEISNNKIKYKLNEVKLC